MKLLKIILLNIISIVFVTTANAQIFVPISADNPTVTNSSSEKIITNKDLDVSAFMTNTENGNTIKSTSVSIAPSIATEQPLSFPVCSTIPTVDAVNVNTEYNQTLLTTAAALKAGVPFLTFEGSANQKVLVRDFVKGAECLASDNITRLKYGYTVRMIITLADFSGQANLSLPVVAANATANGKSNKVNLVVYGIGNPKITTIIANIASKELNVETYHDFTLAAATIIGFLNEADTVKVPTRLGIITSEASPLEYREGIVKGFALTQITKGKTCSEAKTKFPQGNIPVASLIDETYVLFVGVCDAITKPDNGQKDKAKRELLNLEVN